MTLPRTILILSFLLALVSISPIEYERALILHVEELVRGSPSTTGYRYLGKGRFEFMDIRGLTWQRSFGNVRTMGGLQPKKIISIDLRNLDTSGYFNRTFELTVIQVGAPAHPPIGGLMDSVSHYLLVGPYYILQPRDPVRIYSMDASGNSFTHVYSFPSGFYPDDLTDIDLDGRKELIGDSLGCVITFKRNPITGLPVDRDYFWYGKTGSAQVPRITDLDGDNYSEITMGQFGDGFHGTKIVKYYEGSRKLEKVFQIRYPHNPGFRGYWAVGDFDKDGKQEFVTANYAGEVYFVEHVAGDTSYAITFSDTTRYINAFFHTEGNDLDGDGRPECFIGSDNTGGLNNIAVYETTGDNNFEVSAWIEIYPLGSFVWQWIWTGDVDGDGKDEITLSSVNTLVILKAFGNDDYRVIWYKKYDGEVEHRLFDVDGDGKLEILLSSFDGVVGITKILSWSLPTSVEQKENQEHPLDFSIYPNPAGTEVIVRIRSNPYGNGLIELSSITGRVIMVQRFENREFFGSMHRFSLSPLPDGIYFVHLRIGEGVITKKLLVFH